MQQKQELNINVTSAKTALDGANQDTKKKLTSQCERECQHRCSETKNWKEVAFHNFYLDDDYKLRHKPKFDKRGRPSLKNHCVVNGTVKKNGYKTFAFNRREYYLHRFIALLYFKDISGVEVDHINGDRADNSIKNLRLVSRVENSRNRRVPKSSKTKIMGVSWSKTSSKWQAYISTEAYNRVHLGTFEDFFEACCARKAAEVRYNYHTNHGRSWI